MTWALRHEMLRFWLAIGDQSLEKERPDMFSESRVERFSISGSGTGQVNSNGRFTEHRNAKPLTVLYLIEAALDQKLVGALTQTGAPYSSR